MAIVAEKILEQTITIQDLPRSTYTRGAVGQMRKFAFAWKWGVGM